MILNQTLKTVFKKFSAILIVATALFVSAIGLAQEANSATDLNLEQIRWKSESQVRALLGDPNSVHGPVGTHASYTLWKYDEFTIAFANNRAFHLFDKNSLKKFELDENRP
ncbi:MAG: hypothetical protein AAF431_06380 [Pseudomonadota bacterium]